MGTFVIPLLIGNKIHHSFNKAWSGGATPDQATTPGQVREYWSKGNYDVFEII